MLILTQTDVYTKNCKSGWPHWVMGRIWPDNQEQADHYYCSSIVRKSVVTGSTASEHGGIRLQAAGNHASAAYVSSLLGAQGLVKIIINKLMLSDQGRFCTSSLSYNGNGRPYQFHHARITCQYATTHPVKIDLHLKHSWALSKKTRVTLTTIYELRRC